MRKLASPPSIALMVAGLLVLPFVQRPLVASEILILGMAAVAANLLIGYTGMLSFGQAMFFGLGAYTAGILVTKLDVPMILAIPAATLVTAAAACAIGALCVRRTGLYFLMITFAFNQMFYFAAYSFSSLTGGEDGLPGVNRPAFLANQQYFYVFVALILLFQLAIMKRIVDSPTGRILQAIRENEARAAAVGYNVRHYRLIAFTISGLFTGMAGALFAFVFEFVPIDKIHWSFSGDIIFMTLAGGSGHFLGPVAGAALYTVLQETVSVYWNRWPLVIGVIFAAVIMFARTGAAGLIQDIARRIGRRSRRVGVSEEAR
jgi:branched-chain amino acid transport system permease protein